MEKEGTEKQLQLIKMREDAFTKLVSLNIATHYLIHYFRYNNIAVITSGIMFC